MTLFTTGTHRIRSQRGLRSSYDRIGSLAIPEFIEATLAKSHTKISSAVTYKFSEFELSDIKVIIERGH